MGSKGNYLIIIIYVYYIDDILFIQSYNNIPHTTVATCFACFQMWIYFESWSTRLIIQYILLCILGVYIIRIVISTQLKYYYFLLIAVLAFVSAFTSNPKPIVIIWIAYFNYVDL